MVAKCRGRRWPCTRGVLNDFEQRSHVDRLGQVVIGSKLAHVFDLRAGGVCADDGDLGLPKVVVVADGLEDIGAAQVWQMHVEEYETGPILVGELEAVPALSGAQQLDP